MYMYIISYSSVIPYFIIHLAIDNYECCVTVPNNVYLSTKGRHEVTYMTLYVCTYIYMYQERVIKNSLDILEFIWVLEALISLMP